MATHITTEDIQKLAKLARVEIAPNEVESYRAKIEGVLGYIDQIKTVGGALGAPKKDAVRNVMRDDTNPNPSGAFTADIIKGAPRSERNFVKVKKIL